MRNLRDRSMIGAYAISFAVVLLMTSTAIAPARAGAKEVVDIYCTGLEVKVGSSIVTTVNVGQTFDVYGTIALSSSEEISGTIYVRLTIDNVKVSDKSIQVSRVTSGSWIFIWAGQTIANPGSHTVSVNANPDHTLPEILPRPTQNAFANNAKSMVLTVFGSATIAGYCQGERTEMDGDKTYYPLEGVTVVATNTGGTGTFTYTGISDNTGRYSICVPTAMYSLKATYHDHAQASYAVSMYNSGITEKNFLLKCVWRERYQAQQVLFGQDWQENFWRVFEKDVNGDGIVDSVNLFMDAYLLDVGELSPYDMRPYMGYTPYASFWLEFAGFKMDERYLYSLPSYIDTLPCDCMPAIAVSQGAEYVKSVNLYAQTMRTYNWAMRVPSTIERPYEHSATVQMLRYSASAEYPVYAVPNTRTVYNDLKATFNSMPYASWLSPDSWPVRGTIDVNSAMTTLGYLDTRGFVQIESLNIVRWWPWGSNMPYYILFDTWQFEVGYFDPIDDWIYFDTLPCKFGCVITA